MKASLSDMKASLSDMPPFLDKRWRQNQANPNQGHPSTRPPLRICVASAPNIHLTGNLSAQEMNHLVLMDTFEDRQRIRKRVRGGWTLRWPWLTRSDFAQLF